MWPVDWISASALWRSHRLNLRRKTQTGRLKDLIALARTLRLAPVHDDKSPEKHRLAQ